ncbi:MAG: C40 family peptidase [Lachnospiraceae bacterium]|nr:C40 family peptidase [Lachnospiraceae bacterium]
MGNALIGIAVMIVLIGFLAIYLVLFNISLASDTAQLVADSLADGVAVYMANEGRTYAEACDKMDEIREKINMTTGVILEDCTLDEASLDNNEVMITAVVSGVVPVTSQDTSYIPYKITRTAVTRFKRVSLSGRLFGADSDIDYVQWAIETANDDSHGYCLHDRYQGMGHPDYDCSSFVSAALIQCGYITSTFSTSGEYAVLTGAGFICIPYEESALQPGDILYRPRMSLGGGASLSAHTEIYIGNGWIVGAHQSEDAGSDYLYGQPGDQTGTEICASMNDSSAKRWTRIFRLNRQKH